MAKRITSQEVGVGDVRVFVTGPPVHELHAKARENLPNAPASIRDAAYQLGRLGVHVPGVGLEVEIHARHSQLEALRYMGFGTARLVDYEGFTREPLYEPHRTIAHEWAEVAVVRGSDDALWDAIGWFPEALDTKLVVRWSVDVSCLICKDNQHNPILAATAAGVVQLYPEFSIGYLEGWKSWLDERGLLPREVPC